MRPINFNLLKEAKAFLCWDVFPGLAIQLVPIQNAVAYYYPPNDHQSIVVFYSDSPVSLQDAFCLLFHEAGHVEQWQQNSKNDSADEFFRMINLDKGEAKQNFERQAWDFGREYLLRFLSGKRIATTIIVKQYDNYADNSIGTYKDI